MVGPVTLTITYQRDTNVLQWQASHMVKELLLAVVGAAREWVLSKHYIGPKVDVPRNVVFTVQCEFGAEPVIDAPMWNKDLALAMLEDAENGVKGFFQNREQGVAEGKLLSENQFDFAVWYRAQEAKA
jgi:hypothetical protein